MMVVLGVSITGGLLRVVILIYIIFPVQEGSLFAPSVEVILKDLHHNYNTIPATIYHSTFYNYPSYIPIYVPSISLESYKKAQNWSYHSTEIIGMPTYTSDGWIDANGNNIAAPETTDYVAINAPMVLSGNTRTNYVLTVNTVGITENGSLTIEEGGQLVANSVTGEVTVKNSITGYSEELSWYTISSPLKAEVNLAAQDNSTNLLSGNYELYR